MTRMLRIFIVFSVMLFVAVTVASAETEQRSWRCAGKDIKLGDSKARVAQHCGEPDFKEVVSGGSGSDSKQSEEWTYSKNGQFRRILTFKGSKLTRILVTDE